MDIMVNADSLLAISTQLIENRNKKNISIEDLALKSGIEIDTISKIENARKVPSIEQLSKLSQSLEISLSTFFLTIFTQKSEKYMVFRNENRKVFHRNDSEGVNYEPLLSFDITKNALVRSAIITVKAGTNRPPISTDAIELNYIISGSITQIVDNESIDLNTGDTFFLKSTFPHAMQNKSETVDCVMMVVYFMNV